jgi:hypothetical protein
MSLSIASRSVGDSSVITCTGRIVEGDGAATLEASDARVLLRATTPPAVIIDPDSRARLAALTGEDPARQFSVVPWPEHFSTEEAGAAAHELLAGVNRAVAKRPPVIDTRRRS